MWRSQNYLTDRILIDNIDKKKKRVKSKITLSRCKLRAYNNNIRRTNSLCTNYADPTGF